MAPFCNLVVLVIPQLQLMELHGFDDYKSAFRFRLKELQSLGKPLTLKRIADRVPIQYTYLSRVMNRSDAHLTEDQVFSMAKIMEFVPEEIDYLLLLRAYQSSGESERRQFLFGKIERLRKAKQLNATQQEFSGSLSQEMAYLFDPNSVLIYMAIHIRQYRENPKLLAPKLGISVAQLKDTLKKLAAMSFIELAQDGMTVTRMSKAHLHYGLDHPLMRVHQHMMKVPMLSQLLRTPEEKKHCFQATFTMDEKGFEAVKNEFKGFVKKVEGLVSNAKDERMYQMSFDLLEWL